MVCFASPEASPGVRKLLGGIPGYDPFATERIAEFYFDPVEAARAILFFRRYLVHIKGRQFHGKAFRLQPWQRSIVANLVGWRRRKDGTRRYRAAMIFIPRKNGKTALAAGLCNYFLFCDGEHGAEIYAAAADRKQAEILFNIAKAMVEKSPELSDASAIYTRSIVIPTLLANFTALSAEAGTKHGLNAHVVVVDELHAQPDSELVDVLETSQGSREQPVMLYLTTSDYDREGSICNETVDYARQVRDGVLDDAEFLPVLYEASDETRWLDEEEWARANPNLGVSFSIEYLRAKARKAQQIPRFENEFKRLHLNIRTGQKVRWIPLEDWDACIRGGEMLEGEMTRAALEGFLRGRECWGGLDLSSVRDITAFCLAFPEGDGFYLLPYFWIPEEGARERERADRVPYLTWAQAGWIELTPGRSIYYSEIRRRIGEIAEQFHVVDIAYDPWQGEHIAQDLQDDGFEPVKFRQGFITMSPAAKQFEVLFTSHRLAHGGNPVLRWMASNCAIRTDAAGNIKPDKERSSEKIDGIVAAVMAIGRAMESDGGSVYSSRGMIQV